MTDYKDSHGKRLTDYPRPSVAVDKAVLTVRDEILSIALAATEGGRRLPGRFLHEGETLAEAVRRSLEVKVGIRRLVPEQLHVFDSPIRDSRGWVLSVAHLLAVRSDVIEDVALVPVTDAVGLALDHDEIVRLALTRLRELHREHPDPCGLLGEEFTMLERQRLHAAIDPEMPKRDAFRRATLPLPVETGEIRQGTAGKPARLFRRA